MVITRVNNGSPSIMLTAFDVKFHEKKDGMPRGACRPLKKLKTKQCRKSEKVNPQQIEKQNSVEQVDFNNVEQKQCRKKWTLKKLSNNIKIILKFASDEIIICLIVCHPRIF